MLNQSGAAPDALQRVGKLFSDPSFPNNLADIGIAIFEVAREHANYFKLVYIDVLEFQGKNVSHIIGGFRKGFSQLGVVLASGLMLCLFAILVILPALIGAIDPNPRRVMGTRAHPRTRNPRYSHVPGPHRAPGTPLRR